MTINPDPTPPSPSERIPSWGRQLIREHYQLRKDHDALKSKQAADIMSNIQLLAGIASSVTTVSLDVTKLNKQIWGAIKQLRGKK